MPSVWSQLKNEARQVVRIFPWLEERMHRGLG
jgi:hypothetical protein